jgi:hypothetical protein
VTGCFVKLCLIVILVGKVAVRIQVDELVRACDFGSMDWTWHATPSILRTQVLTHEQVWSIAEDVWLDNDYEEQELVDGVRFNVRHVNMVMRDYPPAAGEDVVG